MALADLIVDGASATLINKATDILERQDDGTLEYEARQEMLGGLKTRIVDAAKDYAKNFGNKIKQDAINTLVNLGRDASSDAKAFAQRNLNFEQYISSTVDNLLEKGSYDSIQNGFKTTDYAKNQATVSKFLKERDDIRKSPTIPVPKLGTIISTPPGAADFPKLINFYRAIASNNPVFKLMHKYYFMVTIKFDDKLLADTSHVYSYENGELNNLIKTFALPGQKTIQMLSRRAEIPQIQTETSSLKNEFGHMSLPGTTVIPSDNALIIGFLSSEYSVHESLMLEWIKQTAHDTYCYTEKPFMKAEIDIDFFDQGFRSNILTYRFVDCFPQNIALLDASYDDINVNARDVRFNFNYMKIIRRNDPITTPDNASNNSGLQSIDINPNFSEFGPQQTMLS